VVQELTRQEILRYSRHLLIPEIGLEGQRRLKSASALIVGSGGLGSPVLLYLAAAGVGRLGVVDHDVVEESNLQRQVIHGSAALGTEKVNSARARLEDLNPHIQVDTYQAPFTAANAIQIAQPYDVIVDCSDNFPTRYLTSDLCVLTHKPNIYGAVFRFDGQASVFDARLGPCYRCLFPEPPPPGLVPTCNDAGVMGILPGTIGTIQATEALKILLGIGASLTGKLLLYNAFDMSFEQVILRKNPACRVCGDSPEIHALIDYDDFCGVSAISQADGPGDQAWDITVRQLAARLKKDKNTLLIDVREAQELVISHLDQAKNIPLGELAGRMDELDGRREIVLICRSGTRSRRALEVLVSAGFTRVRNLQGGINAWAREIDPDMPVY